MRDPAPTAAVQVIGRSGGAGRGATGQRGPSRGRRDGPGRLPRSSAWWGWARGAPALISPAAARGGAQATGGRMCGMCQAHLPTPGEGRGRGRPRGGAGPEPRGWAGANLFVPLHRAQSCLLPPRALPAAPRTRAYHPDPGHCPPEGAHARPPRASRSPAPGRAVGSLPNRQQGPWPALLCLSFPICTLCLLAEETPCGFLLFPEAAAVLERSCLDCLELSGAELGESRLRLRGRRAQNCVSIL